MTQGTKEWADSNVNICRGCSHDCVYCYAKGMAYIYRREVWENWKNMELNPEAIKKGYRKRKGRIMFPTSHDITPATVNESIFVLRKMLKAGNEVLITTKPHLDVITALCTNLKHFKNRVQFRFTITARDESLSLRYEPGAPLPKERYQALAYAFQNGFKTSVSIEPYLEHVALVPFLVKKIQDHVTESIWLGPMNKKFCPVEFWDDAKWSPTAIRLLYVLINCDRQIQHSKIRFKDAFREKLNQISTVPEKQDEEDETLPNEKLVIEFL